MLEIDLLKQLQRDGQMELFSRVDVDQFYGIEPKRVPRAHRRSGPVDDGPHYEQSAVGEFFSPYIRIPLKKSPHIHPVDALETDWASVLPPEQCSFVLGNPPFAGAKYQSEKQRAQVRRIARLGGSGGTLDYVTAWFIKAGEYLTQQPRAHRFRRHQLDHTG